MSQQLPQRQAYMLSDLGIRLRKIVSSQDGDTPVRYSHQDDYYIIGMVDKGTGHGFIDFKEIAISQGEIFLVQPTATGTLKSSCRFSIFLPDILPQAALRPIMPHN